LPFKATILRLVSKLSRVVIHNPITTQVVEAVAVLATRMFKVVEKGSKTKNFFALLARIAKCSA